MNPKKVLVIGSGHLAYRVRSLLKKKGVDDVYIPHFEMVHKDSSVFDTIFETIKGIDILSFSMIYLVDATDEINFEILIALLSINKDLPITASLFNENIAPHIQAAHKNVKILNPIKIAAPTFIEGMYIPVKHSLRYTPVPLIKDNDGHKIDRLILLLGISFFTLILLTICYFHIYDAMSWINAVYFVIVTIATVGYGDINLLNASFVSKFVNIILIVCSTIFVWMIFSLTVDSIIKKREQLSLGRKQYRYKNHVILCGLGKLGCFIAEGLIARGEHVIIVEVDEDSPNIEHFRGLGADVYIGNARDPKVLEAVGVRHAKAVYSVVDNDYVNIEVGLNARSFSPNLRLILRIFDETMSQKIKENLDIHITYSTTAIADNVFVEGV
jgi:Trk K+ transport system NAD-binding subunit